MEEKQEKINELTTQLLHQLSQIKDWSKLDSFLDTWVKQKAISNTDASIALKNADTYLQSEEGKDILRKITDKAGSQKINPNNLPAAIKKLLRELEADEKKQQQKLDKERKAHIGKSVQNSISDALKDIKPWKGLSADEDK
jgi:hypothetical protein